MEEKDDLEKAHHVILKEKGAVFPVMRRQSMDSFRSCLERQGKKSDTVQAYRRCAKRLFAFSSDKKGIRSDTLKPRGRVMKAMTALTNVKDSEALSKSPEDMESCVICGRVTDVPVCRPISKRKTYMPAAGHLCDACCQKYCGVKDLRILPWLWDEFL